MSTEAAARYQANREKKLARNKQYQRENAARMLERQRKWRAANPEKVREQRRRAYARNPELFAKHVRARRAIKRGATGPAEKIRLDDIWNRDGRRCHICGKNVARVDASLDHLVPIAKGGHHLAVNVALAHRVCNSKRYDGRIPAQLRLIG